MVMAADPVLAAGVGLRSGQSWVLRAASFRVGPPTPGRAAAGILTGRQVYSEVLIDMLAGAVRPCYGELRVLGHDMATVRGRAAVRRRVGVARRRGNALPGLRVRGLVQHAARLAMPDRRDRHVLAAAIIDRLSLTPWADVPMRFAPDTVARRARLAAAAVHQPELILLDGLLDSLSERDAVALAEAIRDLSRDSAVLVAGRDSAALALACDDVFVLAGGVLVGGLSDPARQPDPAG
jgi:ABC-2 type transport system ATP-binding protein